MKLIYSCVVLLVYLSVSLGANVTYCPPGFVSNATDPDSPGDGSCVCGAHHLNGIMQCDDQTGIAKLANGYCMTFDVTINSTIVGKCPFRNYTYLEHSRESTYLQLPDSVSDLEEYLCGGFHRRGILCSHCVDSYGPSVTSYAMDCVPCDDPFNYYGRFVYALIQLVPVTLLYIVIIVFDIRLTKSPLNAFTLFCQVIVNMISYDTRLYSRLIVATRESTVLAYSLKLVLSFYGFWNLDFFPVVLPPFCISSSLKGMHLFLLQYFVALYPLLLMAFIYFLVHLYTRHVKVVVVMWKAVKYCLSCRICCVCRWTLKRVNSQGIANSFSSFLVLAYSKILFVSLSYLLPINLYDAHGQKTADSPVLYYEPHVQFLGPKHLGYALASFSILLVFTFLPLLLLFLYPLCPRKCSCSKYSSHSVRFFVESFQGWFKDGTEPGTRDFRIVSGLNPLSRIVFALLIFLVTILVNPASDYWETRWLIPGLLFTCSSMFFALARPYKLDYMNILEGILLALLGTISFLVSYHIGIYLAFFLGVIPMVTVVGYVIYRLFKCTISFNKCTNGCNHDNLTAVSPANENTSLIDRLENPERYSDHSEDLKQNNEMPNVTDKSASLNIEVTPVYTY